MVVVVVEVDRDIKRTSREAGPRSFLRFFPRKLSLSSPSSISEGSYGHWILWVVERSLPFKKKPPYPRDPTAIKKSSIFHAPRAQLLLQRNI